MSRKEQVKCNPEEKREIVLEGLRSGNIAETCRRYGIAPNLYYRWKEEARQSIGRYIWDWTTITTDPIGAWAIGRPKKPWWALRVT